MPRLQELYDERLKLTAENRTLLETAGKQADGMTADQTAEWEQRDTRIEAIGGDIERNEKQAKRDTALEAPRGRRTEPSEPGRSQVPAKKDEQAATEFSYPLKFGKSLGGMVTANDARTYRYDGPTATTEYRTEFASYVRSGHPGARMREQAAMQADSDTLGGYTVAPQQFVAGLLKFVDDAVFIRQLATVIQVPSAASLGAVSLDTDMGDPTWTSELLTGAEDSSLAFGKRELTPHPLARRIKISNKLIRLSSLGIEALVQQRLAYKFGTVQEAAFLTGTGAGQPLGLLTASTSGISTGRDVSTDNTTTAMTADGLINAFYSLKSQYQDRATWMFHRDAVKQIRKFKDGEGQYMWNPGMLAGQPSLIFGRPYIQSEFISNTFTTGLYVGIVGDFSYYWIAESLGMTVQRLVELYAETNQIGLIGRMELDAMPVLEEAFARIKLA